MSTTQNLAANSATQTLTIEFSDGVALETLDPLDTICVRTRNSDYRIFLLDPKTGRALIQGGPFAEPVDALVNGSVTSSISRTGWIGIGMRLEFWTDGKLTSTSPVQSYHVEAHTPTEFRLF